jgi:drug/metabolite transporter (DMT)-like permease
MLAGENPRVLLFYPAVLGTLVMSGSRRRSTGRRRLPWQHVTLIVMGGCSAPWGTFLFILAFRHAPASALTPFTYMQLVWATLLGWSRMRSSRSRIRWSAWR